MIWPRPGFIGNVRITQVIINVVLMVGFLESYLSFANVYNILRVKRNYFRIKETLASGTCKSISFEKQTINTEPRVATDE